MQKTEKQKNRETVLSLVILAILAVAATGVFLAQFRYNPAVLVPSAFQTEKPGGIAPPSQPQNIVESLPENWVSMTPPETFGPDDLSEKINGKAELYLSSGFLRLRCQRFKETGISDSWAEVFIYDMGNASNAFSVFSSQRRDNAEPLELSPFSYRTENAVFMAYGPYYLEMIASSASEGISEAMQFVAGNFIRDNRTENADEEGSVSEQLLFPTFGLEENSISLLSANVFGYDALDQVFTATYKIENKQATAFFSRRKTPSEAEELASGYHKFLTTFGGTDVETGVPIRNAEMVNIMDMYDFIFTCGPFFAGVHDAESVETAEKLSDMLYKRLAETNPADCDGTESRHSER